MAGELMVQDNKMEAQERFTNKIISLYEAECGRHEALGEYQRTLAQHLFLKVDASMRELNAKRSPSDNRPPFTWDNVDMRRLALDAVNRVQLGIDALLPAHLYVIPYLDGKTGKYTLDLRIGYRGELYYRKAMAAQNVKDIRIELVYSTDEFEAIKKDAEHDVETYRLKVTKPFDRGNIVGGIAYIVYDDPTMNQLIIVTEDEMKRSEQSARQNDFWRKFPAEMKYKTIVRRAVACIPIDPKKVNAAAYLELERSETEETSVPKAIETTTVSFADESGADTEEPDF